MNNYPEMTAEEAAELIKNGQNVACCGFTGAGCVKVVPRALAKRAETLHAQGIDFNISVFTGASSNDSVDGSLSRANAITRRFPYQSNKDLRNAINANELSYADLHLSSYPQWLSLGILGEIDWAIVEVSKYTADGELTLTSSIGATPTICENAKHIILEHNSYHPSYFAEAHDIYRLNLPPFTQVVPLEKVQEHIGVHKLRVDPEKIVAVVKNHEPDNIVDFSETTETHRKIGENVANFLLNEMRENRIPTSFLPIQSGVGNIGNAVLQTLGDCPQIPNFSMYTEVAQNAVVNLMKKGRIRYVSTTALNVTNDLREYVYQNWEEFKNRLVLRPQAITNNPEIIRRLGVISLNTVLEADIYGNANSTHVLGTRLMNGIGGSGDFTRNAYISILTLPSTSKNGTISGIVPFCSHIDHTEHDVQVIITEQGIADLRGKSPVQRMQSIIENCAHPDYKPLLKHYIKKATPGHIPHCLAEAFCFHQAFAKQGDMRSFTE